MKESLSKILGSPDFIRIEALIELISQEISESDKNKNYHQLISSVINDFQKG